jgi:hypothetical protein
MVHRESTPGRARARSRMPWALVTLTALTAAAWVAVLAHPPLPTDPVRSVLTLAAAAGTLVLAGWLPVAVVRRWVAAPWRASTASVGALLVVVLGGWLAAVALV